MITNYDAIAEEYKKAKLQPWRLYVETFMLFDLVGDLTGKSVLDLGCGEGFHTRLLRQKGADRVVGVDLFAGMIDLARKQEEHHPLGIEYATPTTPASPTPCGNTGSRAKPPPRWTVLCAIFRKGET